MAQEWLFRETQKFHQWWVWLVILGINGLFAFAWYQQIIHGEAFGDNPMTNAELWVDIILCAIVTFFFVGLRLQTGIREDGIYIRFFPFHLKYVFYPWATIQECYIRKYNPLAEYGGWGLRYGWLKNGMAFNVSGNMGLQLVQNNGKKRLIGTLRANEIESILTQIGQYKEPAAGQNKA